MTAIMLAAQLALSVPACTTVQPSPAFVCHNGGWLPPGHPLLPQAPPEPPAPPPVPPGAQTPLVLEFKVGRSYRRPASGVEIHIVAVGPLKSGLATYAAECLNEVTSEQCWYPGAGRFILANANALGWEELP